MFSLSYNLCIMDADFTLEAAPAVEEAQPTEESSPISDIEFYFEGDDYFRELFQAIRQARHSIDLEFYIIASDSLGWEFVDLLCQKSDEGVVIRLMYDSIGCYDTSMYLFDKLERHGVNYRAYNPILPLWRNLGRRNHRKMAIIDGMLGFLGGFNLGANYSQRHQGSLSWRDTGAKLFRRSLVEEMVGFFEESWSEREKSFPVFLKVRRRRFQLLPGSLQLVPNYGWRRKSLIRHEYLRAILRARESIQITNAYFVPDHGILRALRKAARRGVKVELLTAGKSDVAIARWAGQATYSRLLKAGVRIFEYQKRMLHAKSASIDGEWFTVGTANIDHMSFFKNLEINLFGRDVALAAILKAQFREDLKSASEIKLEAWRKRSWFAKLLERFFFWMREWL